MKISVTMDHITRGVPADPCHCPIAMAILDSPSHDEPESIVVNGGCISIGYKVYKTPPIAEKFINDFDLGNTVSPIEFELDEHYIDIP